jgi:spectinomycin phosphotransferase
VSGRTATEMRLSEDQWLRFGAALKMLHIISLPTDLATLVPRETYSPNGRDQVRGFLKLAEETVFEDPVAARLATYLISQREQILDLVVSAERLAATLRANTQPFVVCHTDVHANNLLIDDSGRLFIVDWDEPIYALKERDLMFIGGAQRFAGYEASEEHALFYRGYGETVVDPVALAYHRYERIVQDIMAYCDQLLLHRDRAADREPAYERVTSNFVPDGTVEQARRADPTRPQKG